MTEMGAESLTWLGLGYIAALAIGGSVMIVMFNRQGMSRKRQRRIMASVAGVAFGLPPLFFGFSLWVSLAVAATIFLVAMVAQTVTDSALQAVNQPQEPSQE